MTEGYADIYKEMVKSWGVKYLAFYKMVVS